MTKSILKKDKDYTFSDYFELSHPTREILAEFGYQYRFEKLTLPRSTIKIDSLKNLQETYEVKLPLISLTSEIAKREFYISPFLLEILSYLQAEINVEYPLDAGRNLRGTIDYLIKYKGNMVVIEAKKGDLERGFNQLAVELIALDKYLDETSMLLYGAITLGDVWRFGVLNRNSKRLTKDMNVYSLFGNLESLFYIILGILEN